MKLTKETLDKSAFIKKWKKDMMRTMRTIEADWTDEEIETVNPGKQGQQVKMKLPIECEEDWILRRKK